MHEQRKDDNKEVKKIGAEFSEQSGTWWSSPCDETRWKKKRNDEKQKQKKKKREKKKTD